MDFLRFSVFTHKLYNPRNPFFHEWIPEISSLQPPAPQIKKNSFKLESELQERNLLLCWRFSEVMSPRHKSKSWKAGRAKRGDYRPVHSHGKKEKKVWTKGRSRHKGGWIIQYAPLLDSFVILYNGLLEKNRLIAWKRSSFLSHHALMFGEKEKKKMSPFCCKYLLCSSRMVVSPAGWKWPTSCAGARLYAQP